MFQLEVDELVGKKQLSSIVDMCFHTQGEHRTAQVLDAIKALGYKYSTIGAITVSVSDIKVPPTKEAMLAAADEEVRKVNAPFRRGLLSEDERYNRVIKIWGDCTASLREQILPNLEKFNPIRMMTDSGARGSSQQVPRLPEVSGGYCSADCRLWLSDPPAGGCQPGGYRSGRGLLRCP